MQKIKNFTEHTKEIFFFSALTCALGFFPAPSFAQAPYVPTPVSQPLTQPLGATPYVPTPVSQPLTQPLISSGTSTTSQTASQSVAPQANLHSATSVTPQTSTSQSQSMTMPTAQGTPITMTVTTNINNPQTQNVPVNNTASTPIHLQNQNTLAPVPLLQNQPCPPTMTPVPQQNYRTSDPYGSLCAPSLDRNMYLTSTYDMLVPRRHLYSNDPAKTSKPEPRIYTRNPLVRKEQVAYYQPDYSAQYGTIGSSNKKTSNEALNSEIRGRYQEQLQSQLQINQKEERVTVYPVINRGDGVRALGIIQASNSNSSKNQNTSQNTKPASDKSDANAPLQTAQSPEPNNSASTSPESPPVNSPVNPQEIHEEIQK